MENLPTHSELPGGVGDSYLSQTEANRLIAMLAQAGKRFDLHPSVRRFMVKRTARLARSRNPRTAQAAITNLIRMAALDQRDEHHAQDLLMSQQGQRHLHQHSQAGQVVMYLPDNGRGLPKRDDDDDDDNASLGSLPADERRERLETIAARVQDREASCVEPGPGDSIGDDPQTGRTPDAAGRAEASMSACASNGHLPP